MPASPRYPSLTPTTLQLALSLIARQPRSFRKDAQAFVRRLRPPLRVLGQTPAPSAAGRVVLANHFRSRSFRAWWIPFALTATLDEDIHWVMTSAWTYPDPLRSHLLTPLTRRLFRRLARTYAFTLMPPMPLVGLVPEGGDSPEGDLMAPPSGVGRFISLLAARGLELLPAGVFEADGALCLRFGKPIAGPFEANADPETRDRLAAVRVMKAIASCLPDALRGPYSRGGSQHALE